LNLIAVNNTQKHLLISSGRRMGPSQRPLNGNTQHSQQTSMTPARFEPAIPAIERQQTYDLDGVATGIDRWNFNRVNQQCLYLLSVLTKQLLTRKSTYENLFQLIALVYINIKVILTSFAWYTWPSSGCAHKGYTWWRNCNIV